MTVMRTPGAEIHGWSDDAMPGPGAARPTRAPRSVALFDCGSVHGLQIRRRRERALDHRGGANSVFDHHDVARAMAAIDRGLKRLLGESSPSVAASRSVTAAVERLEVELPRHFAMEEGESGFFAEMLPAYPDVGRRLDALRSEHEPLAARLRALADAARWAGLSLGAWQRVAKDFRAFAEELQRHELAEDSVVAEALLTHEGGPG